jgi:hypothetical protein
MDAEVLNRLALQIGVAVALGNVRQYLLRT